MKILAITLSNPLTCSIAIKLGEYQSIQLLSNSVRASESVLSAIDQILKSHQIELSQLDCLAFDRGPGSFMGIRLAASIIQGLAIGSKLPIVPISSLQALARWGGKNYPQDSYFLASLDARQSERYWCLYQRALKSEPLDPDRLWMAPKTPEQVSSIWIPQWVPDLDHSENSIQNSIKILDNDHGTAIEIAELASVYYQQGYSVLPQQAVPIYLRNRVT